MKPLRILAHLVPALSAWQLAAAVPLDTRAPSNQSTSPITWDSYSLMIDGERVTFWGAEMHPFRLPSVNLWKDVLEKIKAGGYNVVQSYFNWAVHSWNEETVDFTGIRDIELFLQMANETGLYVSARPGPYINAEVSAGGMAEWTKTLKGKARTSSPDWTRAWQPYIRAMAKLLARYQYPHGPVIAVQIDNEFMGLLPTNREYMALLIQTYKDAGIYVPTFHNYPIDLANPWTGGHGAPDIVGYDWYPMSPTGCPSDTSDWTQVMPPFIQFTKYKTDVPLFLPEFGTGAFSSWGGNSEDLCRQRFNTQYERVFNKWVVSNGATMVAFYMTFGGQNWGNLRFPTDYTSYDYGAPIDESRQIGDKYYENKLLGYFLAAAAADITQTDKHIGVTSDLLNVANTIRRNPETNAEFHVLWHLIKPNTATSSFSLKINGVNIPQQKDTSIILHGRDAKILPANIRFLGQHLVYSTSEVLTWGNIDGTDYFVVYGAAGDDGEIVLSYVNDTAPAVSFNDKRINGTSTFDNHQLRLNYAVQGVSAIQITNVTQPLTVLVADIKNAYQFWRLDTRHGPAFIFGGYLVRGESSTKGSTLWLRGDANETSTLDVFASSKFDHIAWNDQLLQSSTSSKWATAVRRVSIAGPKRASVPKLSKWTVGYEAPERFAAFDDASWVVANHTSTNYWLKPLLGRNVLYADDYGYHVGHIWYRGTFTATGSEKSLLLTVQGGANSIYAVWLNGAYMGSYDSGATGMPRSIDFPEGAIQQGKKNVVAILVDNMGSDEQSAIELLTDQYKSYRGIYDVRVMTSFITESSADVTWRIQGNLGGENIVDTARGTYNSAGKLGERKGWHLPGFPATRKNNFTTNVALPHTFGDAGITWYFTDFTLDFPSGTDHPVAVSFDKPDASQHYRAEFYINGWNFGKLIPDLGPQFDFPVPPGILDTQGRNRLAIAVHGTNAHNNTFPPVHLTILNSYTFGGLPWKNQKAPDFDPKIYGTSTSL
ncbi:glycoside hydrolase superfamily [Gongronella butleri]|nr:glycoside hydrolase superfamily [Gongronella butleri]